MSKRKRFFAGLLSTITLLMGAGVTAAGDRPSHERLGETVELPGLRDDAGKPVVAAFLS